MDTYSTSVSQDEIRLIESQLLELYNNVTRDNDFEEYMCKTEKKYSYFVYNDPAGKYVQKIHQLPEYNANRTYTIGLVTNLIAFIDSLPFTGKDESMTIPLTIPLTIPWPYDVPENMLKCFSNPDSREREEILDYLDDLEGKRILGELPDDKVAEITNLRNILSYILITVYIRKNNAAGKMMDLFKFLGSEHEFLLQDLEWMYEVDYRDLAGFADAASREIGDDDTEDEDHDHDDDVHDNDDYDDDYNDNDDDDHYYNYARMNRGFIIADMQRDAQRREQIERERAERVIAREYQRSLRKEYESRERDKAEKNPAYYAKLDENCKKYFDTIGYEVTDKFTDSSGFTYYRIVSSKSLPDTELYHAYEIGYDIYDKMVPVSRPASVVSEEEDAYDAYLPNYNDSQMLEMIIETTSKKSFHTIDKFIRQYYNIDRIKELMIFDHEALKKVLQLILLGRKTNIIAEIREAFDL
jgi:hypothetical protein